MSGGDGRQTSFDEIGRLLIEERRRIDGAEARWLERLAAFDAGEGWSADGHLSAVSWLVDRCGMSRPAAKERLRVAKELRRRPLLSEAFAAGDVSYSKVRALTRIEGANEATDEALLAAARVATARDLDYLVQHWQELQHQDRPLDPKPRWERRGLRRYRRYDGLEVIEIVLAPEDAERLVTVLDEYLRHQRQAEAKSEPVDPAGATDDQAHPSEPVDPAGATDDDQTDRTGQPEPVDPAGAVAQMLPLPPTWAQKRADALVDLVEETVARLDEHGPLGTDRVSVGVVLDYDVLRKRAGRSEISGGAPLTGDAARRLACDAGVHRIIVRGKSEVLDVGRETRQWNRAQRRAIMFRHGGRCAVRGCDRRIVEIHHTTWWTNDGLTDLDAGVPLCYGHHRLVHEGGWSISYNGGTGTTTLRGPQGQRVVAPAAPTPAAAPAPWRVAA